MLWHILGFAHSFQTVSHRGNKNVNKTQFCLAHSNPFIGRTRDHIVR